MPVDLLPWVAAAIAAGAGGLLALVGGRAGRLGSLIATGLSLIGALAGVGWRSVAAGAWPGYLSADALALLGAGALVIWSWSASRAGRAAATFHGIDRTQGSSGQSGLSHDPAAAAQPAPDTIAVQRSPVVRHAATGLALLGIAALLGAAVFVAWRTPAPSPTWGARAPLFGLRSLLAAAGLGGWLIVLAASAPWAVRVPRRRETHSRPADDPGRLPALITFPWLTAALLAGGAWQLAARAAPWHSAPAALWQIVAWLLGASYLHITSNWRPVRAPAWLATMLAGLAFVAAILAALQAASWLL